MEYIDFLSNLTFHFSDMLDVVGGFCCKTDNTYKMVISDDLTPEETILVFIDLFHKMVVEKKEIAINNKTALAGTSTV